MPDTDPPRCCRCGQPLTPQEIATFGGARCEDCWGLAQGTATRRERMPAVVFVPDGYSRGEVTYRAERGVQSEGRS